MKREIKTKFYLFYQNNSGGYFIQNDDVDVYVAIEATDLYDLKVRAERIFAEHSYYCECCGERWSDSYSNLPMYDTVEEIKTGVTEWTAGEETAIIHYITGKKEAITLKIKECDKSRFS